jgi:hypothetical protein
VIIPYMCTVYFKQEHCIPIFPFILPLSHTVFGGSHFAIFIQSFMGRHFIDLISHLLANIQIFSLSSKSIFDVLDTEILVG